MIVKLPIVVSGPMKEQLLGLLRYALLILATSLVAKHWLPVDTDIQQIVGLLMGLITAAWSQTTVRQNNAEKQVLEKYAPDEIAQTIVAPAKFPKVTLMASGFATAIVLGLMLSLAACAPALKAIGNIPANPAAVASQTKLDEQAALSVELAYKAARLTVSTATRAGLVTPQNATKLAAADNKAYMAVVLVREAYAAGNAASYSQALTAARAAIADIVTLSSGN